MYHQMIEVAPRTKQRAIFFWLLIAMVVVGVKLLLRKFVPWTGYVDLSEISLIFTGVFFITGQMFSAINTDVKEAEKIPGDVASSLDQLHDTMTLIHNKCTNKTPEDIIQMEDMLIQFTTLWIEDITQSSDSLPDVLKCLKDLAVLCLEWEKRGATIAIQGVVVIDKVRRQVIRASTISRTDVLPAAQGLLQFFVLSSTVILFLTIFKNEYSLAFVMACAFTVLWFMTFMISEMDDPFNGTQTLQKKIFGVVCEVHLFPLQEFKLRLLAAREKRKAPPPPPPTPSSADDLLARLRSPAAEERK